MPGGDGLRVAGQTAIAIQQGAMGGGVEQAAIVLLAMHLQQQRAQVFQQPHAHRRIVDEGAAAPVGGQGPAQHDLAVQRHLLLRQQNMGRVPGLRFEDDGGAALGGARAHAGSSASAHRQPQRIQQDGFARPRLAGQHIEAGREFQRRLLDQNDVPDGQCRQHAGLRKAKKGIRESCGKPD